MAKKGNPKRDAFIAKKLAKMSLAEKIGQLLTFTRRGAMLTPSGIEQITKRFPGVHTTCGLTNVSYGLPNRRLVNRVFLVAAIIRGLDSAILDPTDKQLFGALKAALMITGEDEFCMEYITAFREGRLE